MKWMNNLKIRQKLLLGFGIVIVLTLIITVFSFVQLSNVVSTYNNVLNGSVERCISTQSIDKNYSMYRRFGAAAIIGYDDKTAVNTLAGEYNTLKAETNEKISDYLASLEKDTYLGDEVKNTRSVMVNELKSILDNEYDTALNSLFDYALDGEEKKAIEVMNNASTLAANITGRITELLESEISTKNKIVANTDEIARSSERLIIVFSALAIVLAAICALIIANTITKGIKMVTVATKKISEGNFDVSVAGNGKDEVADLSCALLHLRATVQNLVSDIGQMAGEITAGDIDARINVAVYEGEYQSVAKGINDTVEMLIEEVLNAIQTTVAFGDGNFDAEIREYPGKKVMMTNSFTAVQSNFKRFNMDIQNVINNAAAGKLDVSIDTSYYKGDWRVMAGGINELLESIVKPIREAIEVLNQLSGGNLDVVVTGNYEGEFAVMKSALNNTLTMLASYIKEISSVLIALSKDDLNQAVEREYVGAFSEIKNALNIIIEKLNHVISDIVSAANQVATGSRQISESSISLAQGASEQASSTEEISATISVINENTKQNDDNAKDAAALSGNSKNNAVMGNKHMDDLLISMDKIKISSNNISKIIKVIEDIAFQTNLLALNAAVEAARAGEHGKGFAVVAEEVRNLAGRSQNSAKETSELIEESIESVNEGMSIAGQTAEALRVIVDDASGIAGIVEKMAISSNDQSTAINQVTEGMTQIARVVQNNSATSEETASAAEELSSQANMLLNLVKAFKLK